MNESEDKDQASFDSFQECEQAKRLREAWQHTPPEPVLREFFDPAILADELLLAQLLVADAESRLQRGQDADLKRYLSIVPELKSGSEGCVQLLLLELMQDAENPTAALDALHTKYGPTFNKDIEEAAGFAGTFSPILIVGAQLGKYQLKEKLGEGSFGQVWRAWDQELERYVALKLFPPSEDTFRQMRKLREEVRAASGINHPNVIGVRSAGRFLQSSIGGARGWLFIDMELCGDAAPKPDDPKWTEVGHALPQIALTEECRPKFTARQAVQMIADLCRGVHQAHIQRVVHCDIKPGNVLVTPSGRAMIADFGLSSPDQSDASMPARHRTGNYDIHHTTVTVISDGKRVRGAPPYMSPEQARGEKLNTLSDVYALGAVLYYLLSGRHPYESKLPPPVAPESAAQDMIAQVADPKSQPAPMPTRIPLRLQQICWQAMQQDPIKRYTSAAEMAEELEAWLLNKPTPQTLPKESMPALMALWGRRSPVITGLLAAVLMVLLFGIAGTSWQAIRATRAERIATAERAIAETARSGAESRSEELRRNLYFSQMSEAGEVAKVIGGLGGIAESLAHWQETKPDLRGWEWYYLYGRAHTDLLTLHAHKGGVRSVSWKPDGLQLASSGADGFVRVWDAASGRQLFALEGKIGSMLAVAWSPDGKRIACGGQDGSMIIWDGDSGRELLKIKAHKSVTNTVAWSPDGSRLATGGFDRMVRIWNASTGEEIRTLSGHNQGVASVGWSLDGKRLASAGHGGGGYSDVLKIWDVASGTEIRNIKRDAYSISWSPDGKHLASGDPNWMVMVIDLDSGQETFSQSHGSHVLSVAWKPDGEQLASAGRMDWAIKIWDIRTQKVIQIYQGHEGPINSVAWSPTGTILASGSDDGTVRLWEAPGVGNSRVQPFVLNGDVNTPVGSTSTIESVGWRPDSSLLATGAVDGLIKVWDASTGKESLTLKGHKDGVFSVDWSPDGTRLASASNDKTIKIWDVGARKELLTLNGHTNNVSSVSWSPDGRRIASGSEDNTVRVWDARTGSYLFRLLGAGPVAAWSPDGVFLASRGSGFTVRVWNSNTGQEVFTVHGHVDYVDSVAWSPNGAYLASASFDHTVKIWSAADGHELATLRGHSNRVGSVVWSPDSTRVASASEDGSVKLWDAASGRLTMTFSRNLAGTSGFFGDSTVSWSPDGMRLALGGRQGYLAIYDASPGYALARRIDGPTPVPTAYRPSNP